MRYAKMVSRCLSAHVRLALQSWIHHTHCRRRYRKRNRRFCSFEFLFFKSCLLSLGQYGWSHGHSFSFPQPTRVAPLGMYNCFPELPSFLWLLLVRLACRKKSPSNAHPTFLSVITSYLLFASIPTSSRTASSFLVCPTRCIFNILTSASSKSLHAIYSSFSSGRSVHWNHLFFALPLVIFWLCRRCVTTTKCEALWIKERLACCARRRLSVKWKVV